MCENGASKVLTLFKDVGRAREEYGIVGTLVGSIGSCPMQNRYHGLPLLLNEQECALLPPDFFLSKRSTSKDKEVRRMERIGRVLFHAAQSDATNLRNQYEKTRQHVPDIAEPTLPPLPTLVECQEWVSEHQYETMNEYVIQFMHFWYTRHDIKFKPTQFNSISHHNLVANPDIVSCTDDASLLPRSPEEEDHGDLFLFKNLHKHIEPFRSQAKDATHLSHTTFITTGMKYGCRWNVYPGDPFRFHSTAMVRWVPYSSHSTSESATENRRTGDVVRMRDLCRWARVAVKTRKTVVLGSVLDKDGKKEAIYYSVNWVQLATKPPT